MATQLDAILLSSPLLNPRNGSGTTTLSTTRQPPTSVSDAPLSTSTTPTTTTVSSEPTVSPSLYTVSPSSVPSATDTSGLGTSGNDPLSNLLLNAFGSQQPDISPFVSAQLGADQSSTGAPTMSKWTWLIIAVVVVGGIWWYRKRQAKAA